MKLEDFRQGLTDFWDSVSEGWQHLRRSASSALTGFKPGANTNLPAKSEVDDMFYIPSGTWSMLGGNLFEDDKRIVVTLEVPGMERQDLDVEVQDDVLTVKGEKRFEPRDLGRPLPGAAMRLWQLPAHGAAAGCRRQRPGARHLYERRAAHRVAEGGAGSAAPGECAGSMTARPAGSLMPAPAMTFSICSDPGQAPVFYSLCRRRFALSIDASPMQSI